MIKKYKEADLYYPIKNFFEKLDYTVHGEVKNCDLTATKDDLLIVVELKTSFNITLLYQAMDRQSITSQVYVAIPRDANKKSFKNMIKICKKLQIGIIMVALDSPIKFVEILLFPTTENTGVRKNKKNRVLNEMLGRSIDINTGGTNKQKIMTAYKEKNIQIACTLEKIGSCSAKILIKEYNCPENTSSILNSNFYDWFIKIDRGVFVISEKCKSELNETSILEITNYYRG